MVVNMSRQTLVKVTGFSTKEAARKNKENILGMHYIDQEILKFFMQTNS
jgi:hypothetical protein